MRLLNTHSFKLEDFNNRTPPPYAILSHRWGDDEVLFKDLGHSRAKRRKGYSKLESFCLLARSRKLSYAWIDTCCIDKSNGAELAEAINSMYRWYQRAAECYAFLADVHGNHMSNGATAKEFTSSVWFTRGWTLQELLAPSQVSFYNSSWQCLGTKAGLNRFLSAVTLIEESVLDGRKHMAQCSVSQKMSWAARRTTTKVEDRAYSLLGIFNVSMPTAYGEGDRAFQRLQEEIINRTDDHTLFAWSNTASKKSALASSPSCFEGSSRLVPMIPVHETTSGYLHPVKHGLSIQLCLIPWAKNTFVAPLRCGYSPSGTQTSGRPRNNYQLACLILQPSGRDNQYLRVSLNGNDLIMMDGGMVADLLQKNRVQRQQIVVRT